MTTHNIAIVAHVDHGKTTLVDAILKQSNIFRDNQKEMQQELLMDSNDLEKEKGITILAKNTSVEYQGNKINIIDTPGHADFGSEVERVLNMASGALLLVDAAEGPLPQTRFVLQKALEAKLKIILLINKIDKHDARPTEIIHEVETLLLELADDEDALNFQTLYGVGRDGKIFYELPEQYDASTEGDMAPLLQTIVDQIPNSAIGADQPFQMQISTLDYDTYVGRICIGKVTRGTLQKGQRISLVDENGVIGTYTASKLFTSVGLQRAEVAEIQSGDICALAGIPELTIGQTVTDPDHLQALPTISIEEPTIKITIAPNSSPFSGREGSFVTSRQIRARLSKELETNVGLKVEEDDTTTSFLVSGRGELHLAVLIETMRREGFELEVSKPQVIIKQVDGVASEPFEEVIFDVPKEFVGYITEDLGKRKGTMIEMTQIGDDQTRLKYHIASRNLLGIRSSLLTNTKGTAIMNAMSLGYKPQAAAMDQIRNGSLIASQSGTSVTYGLVSAQERGKMLIGPGVEVYAGMVVGIANQEQDLPINVCKTKKLTNNRSSGEGVKAVLEPPMLLSLEQYLDLIADDELLEVTPENIRLRKRYLNESDRKAAKRNG